MANSTTADYETVVRKELLSSIYNHLDIVPGTCNDFLYEWFGIENTDELHTIPFSKLQEIADEVESVFC